MTCHLPISNSPNWNSDKKDTNYCYKDFPKQYDDAAMEMTCSVPVSTNKLPTYINAGENDLNSKNDDPANKKYADVSATSGMEMTCHLPIRNNLNLNTDMKDTKHSNEDFSKQPDDPAMGMTCSFAVNIKNLVTYIDPG